MIPFSPRPTKRRALILHDEKFVQRIISDICYHKVRPPISIRICSAFSFYAESSGGEVVTKDIRPKVIDFVLQRFLANLVDVLFDKRARFVLCKPVSESVCHNG
jgi:hypothetical protein